MPITPAGVSNKISMLCGLWLRLKNVFVIMHHAHLHSWHNTASLPTWIFWTLWFLEQAPCRRKDILSYVPNWHHLHWCAVVGLDIPYIAKRCTYGSFPWHVRPSCPTMTRIVPSACRANVSLKRLSCIFTTGSYCSQWKRVTFEIEALQNSWFY